MEVYIPSTRKILSPTCPNSDSTPPAATPRIYVLPISPSGASPKSTVVPAKLDRRSKNSKQGELPGTPIAYIDSPTPGALVKVDKVPNPDILRSPVVREKEQGGTLGDLGCYGLESAESENLETKTVNNQVDRRSMDQSNLTCEGDLSLFLSLHQLNNSKSLETLVCHQAGAWNSKHRTLDFSCCLRTISKVCEQH